MCHRRGHKSSLLPHGHDMLLCHMHRDLESLPPLNYWIYQGLICLPGVKPAEWGLSWAVTPPCNLPLAPSSFRIVQLLEPYLLFTYIWEPGHTAPLGIRNSEAHMQQMPFQVVTGRSELQGPQAARNPLGFLGLCQMNMLNKASLKKDHFTEGNSEESHLQQGTSMVCQSIGCHSGLSVCFI